MPSLDDATRGSVLFGGDYNPEQWPREVWREDARLMREAGVNLATVGAFSWAMLEPTPGAREFGWLDEVLDVLHADGIGVALATPTACPPPWMGRRWPETLPSNADGTVHTHGSRNGFCPSSPVFRRSFAMMRGGHLDVCVLGAYQVAVNGDLANWHTGKPDDIPAVGGAMDLAIGAKDVYVMMTLFTKSGAPKLVPTCTYPLTGVGCVSRVYTESAVFELGHTGMKIRETYGITQADLRERLKV